MEEEPMDIGAFIALGVLLLVHVLCWIAAIAKTIIDRRQLNLKLKHAEQEKLLGEDKSKTTPLSHSNNSNLHMGAKFAISKSTSTLNSNQELSTRTPYNENVAYVVNQMQKSPAEHHFPRSPKRYLSAGNARKITQEELAIMLDSYATKSQGGGARPSMGLVIPSPTRSLSGKRNRQDQGFDDQVNNLNA